MSECAICREALPEAPKSPRRSARLRSKSRSEPVEPVAPAMPECNHTVLNTLNRVSLSCCRGQYHATCLLQWFARNASCPLCRTPFLRFVCAKQHTPEGWRESRDRWHKAAVAVAWALALLITLSALWSIVGVYWEHGLLHVIKLLSNVLVLFFSIFAAAEALNQWEKRQRTPGQ